jgi:hypothetical protein
MSFQRTINAEHDDIRRNPVRDFNHRVFGRRVVLSIPDERACDEGTKKL